MNGVKGMIERLHFQKMKKLKPVVFKESTLFLNIKSYQIEKAYIFFKREFIQFNEIGDLWIKGRRDLKTPYIGYMTVKTFKDITLANEEGMFIGIIGYENNFRYHLIDINFHDSSFSFDGELTINFSFSEYRRTSIN